MSSIDCRGDLPRILGRGVFISFFFFFYWPQINTGLESGNTQHKRQKIHIPSRIDSTGTDGAGLFRGICVPP